MSFHSASCKRNAENLGRILIFSLTHLCFTLSVVMERRYPKEVQDLYETMRRFARIVGPVEHDKFIESHARRWCSALSNCVCVPVNRGDNGVFYVKFCKQILGYFGCVCVCL